MIDAKLTRGFSVRFTDICFAFSLKGLVARRVEERFYYPLGREEII